jgi:hypothetical protein
MSYSFGHAMDARVCVTRYKTLSTYYLMCHMPLVLITWEVMGAKYNKATKKQV